MRRTAALLLALALAGCAAAPGGNLPPDPPVPAPVAAEAAAAVPAIRCPSFDRELFARGVSNPRRFRLDSAPLAGMVPHHLIASDVIAGFFRLAGEWGGQYDTVLLLSPSHFPENCGSDVVTATADWSTPLGTVATDRAVTTALLSNPLIGAVDDPAAVEADHGVTGLVPFVRHYLPEADIAVCLLANGLSRERLEAVWQEVADLCRGRRILLVASVDCSHYLQPGAAALRDVETAQAIEETDLARILTFTDDNVDSPQALTTLLHRVKDGELSLHRLAHTSSAEILPHAASNPVYDEGITTYYVYAATG